MSFQLPHTGSAADVSLQVPYPTAAYTIYLPATDVRLNTNSLTDGGSTVLGDQSYRVYRASNLSGATIVSGELSGLGSSPMPDPVLLAVLSLAVVLCVLGGGAFLVTRSATRTAPQMARADPAQERLDLVVQIAMLDERFAVGEIGYVEYQAQRRLAKQRLHQLTTAAVVKGIAGSGVSSSI
jgi:hypothetical protein